MSHSPSLRGPYRTPSGWAWSAPGPTLAEFDAALVLTTETFEPDPAEVRTEAKRPKPEKKTEGMFK